MQKPLEIVFRHMEPSRAIETVVRRRVGHLHKFYGRIVGCRVVVEAPHRHHRHGNLYHIGIVLSVPGQDVVVGRVPGIRPAHEDAYVALRDAFAAARRRLQEYERRHYGHVKAGPRREMALLRPQ